MSAREFRCVVVAADLPPIRFHDLRYTAAKLLLAQGVEARTIMETLGHSQISLMPHVEHVQSRIAGVAGGRGREDGRNSAPLGFQPGHAHQRIRENLRKLGEPGGNRTPNPQIKRSPRRRRNPKNPKVAEP